MGCLRDNHTAGRVTRRIRLTSSLLRFVLGTLVFCCARIQKPRRREKYLGLFGPLSLLILLGIWAFGLILGYALLLWPQTQNYTSIRGRHLLDLSLSVVE